VCFAVLRVNKERFHSRGKGLTIGGNPFQSGNKPEYKKGTRGGEKKNHQRVQNGGA